MDLLGSSIRPSSSSSELTIGTLDTDDYNPFTSATIFHNGKLTIKDVTDEMAISAFQELFLPVITPR